MATLDRIALRNIVAGVNCGNVDSCPDNLAIALCSYFDYHYLNPGDEEEGECGWTPWVVEQTNITLDALVSELIKHIERLT